MTRSEWEEAARLRKTKRNLAGRQRRLLTRLRCARAKFRADAALQTELRRVAALCLRLGERLSPDLEREVLSRVMDS